MGLTGVSPLSEALKANTTLTTLNICCENDNSCGIMKDGFTEQE